MVPRHRPPDATAPPAELVTLGRIANRHGLRGELRIVPYNAESTAALSWSSLILVRDDGTTERRRVLASRPHKRFVLVTLEGVTTADAAEALIGCAVAVPRAERPPPGPASVYHVDLIGCAVQTTSGEALGTVQELIVTGSNDVCVVRGGGREVLIPLIADVIASLDTSARTIIVHPLPGLIDA
jgi:16S rRNA processing protein RimM